MGGRGADDHLGIVADLGPDLEERIGLGARRERGHEGELLLRGPGDGGRRFEDHGHGLNVVDDRAGPVGHGRLDGTDVL